MINLPWRLLAVLQDSVRVEGPLCRLKYTKQITDIIGSSDATKKCLVTSQIFIGYDIRNYDYVHSSGGVNVLGYQ